MLLLCVNALFLVKPMHYFLFVLLQEKHILLVRNMNSLLGEITCFKYQVYLSELSASFIYSVHSSH